MGQGILPKESEMLGLQSTICFLLIVHSKAHFCTLEASTKITLIHFSNNQSTFFFYFYLDTKNYYKCNKWPLGKASLPFQSFALKSDNELCFNVKCYENKDIHTLPKEKVSLWLFLSTNYSHLSPESRFLERGFLFTAEK